MILSLQGCMAVGKTTAARYLEQHCQQVQVCFEDNAAVLAEIKQRGLNKNSYADDRQRAICSGRDTETSRFSPRRHSLRLHRYATALPDFYMK